MGKSEQVTSVLTLVTEVNPLPGTWKALAALKRVKRSRKALAAILETLTVNLIRSVYQYFCKHRLTDSKLKDGVVYARYTPSPLSQYHITPQ